MQTIWRMLSRRESEMLVCARRKCPHDQPPRKTLGTKSLMRFPGRQHVTHVTPFDAQALSHLTVQGEDTWKPVPGFLQTSPHVPFSFPGFALGPFTVINQS